VLAQRWLPGHPGPDGEPLAIDASVAHSARIHDYMLGGSDHFAVDRDAAERGAAALTGGMERARTIVRSQRAFRAATVRRLAGEMAVREFLDVGPGIPDGDDVHAVAQETAPDSRVVYVDNDYLALTHLASDLETELVEAIARVNETMSDPYILRTRAEVARFMAGLDVAEPGIVTLDWWPWSQPHAPGLDRPTVAAYCAVGRKP
jgi:hypothetical protein